MKTGKLKKTLMIMYCLPMGWFATWWDAMPCEHSLFGYNLHCLLFTVLAVIAVANGFEKIVIPCNVLSTVISWAMTYVVSVGDMDHFFKPRTYHSRVILPMIVSLVVQVFGMGLYFVLKPTFTKD